MIRSIRMPIPAIQTWFEAFKFQFLLFEQNSKRSNANSNHSNGIRSVRMPTPTIWTGFEAFKCQFQPFVQYSKRANGNCERDLRRSNGNSNYPNGIWSVWLPFGTIRTGFEAIECQLQPFKRDSKHSNTNSNHSNGIRSTRIPIPTIRTGFEALECQFQPFERDLKHLNANSNNSNVILSVWILGIGIRSLRILFWEGYPTSHCHPTSHWAISPTKIKKKQKKKTPNHSNGIGSVRMPAPTIHTGFECQLRPFERDSRRSNANSNHSNWIWSVRMRIPTIRTGFEPF